MSSSPSLSRTALITGASRGLGLALARALAQQPQQRWRLLIDGRNAAALDTACAELAQWTEVITLPGDVADAAHRQALAEAALAFGGVDALVNNASILGPSPQPMLLNYPLDVLEQVYRTNTLAPLALIQTLAAKNALKLGARLINITSDAAIEAYEGWGGYGSSKAALEQLSNILAAELRQFRVYWVDPGDMRTQMHQEAFPGEDISDRPLPEVSVPGLLALLAGELPSGRYRAREVNEVSSTITEIIDDLPTERGIRELRVALTVEDFESALRLYRDGFGLEVVKEWNTPEGRGTVLAAGRGTIELLDPADAAYTDTVEAGQRVSGPVRLALEVADVPATAATLATHGAEIVHPPVMTSWGSPSQRLRSPDGLQLTLFQVSPATSVDAS